MNEEGVRRRPAAVFVGAGESLTAGATHGSPANLRAAPYGPAAQAP